jgi:hypothetical protein
MRGANCRPGPARDRPDGVIARYPLRLGEAPGPSWLTILDSGQTRGCDLHVLGSRELNLRTNPGRRVAGCRTCGR